MCAAASCLLGYHVCCCIMFDGCIVSAGRIVSFCLLVHHVCWSQYVLWFVLCDHSSDSTLLQL